MTKFVAPASNRKHFYHYFTINNCRGQRQQLKSNSEKREEEIEEKNAVKS
jgi:hypothetical protein